MTRNDHLYKSLKETDIMKYAGCYQSTYVEKLIILTRFMDKAGIEKLKNDDKISSSEMDAIIEAVIHVIMDVNASLFARHYTQHPEWFHEKK